MKEISVKPIKEPLKQILKEKVPLALFLLILAFAFLRPIAVFKNGLLEKIVWSWPWTEIKITFVNSVTEKIVEIFCFPHWKFSGFRAKTDSETEDYYTNGNYRWNDLLAREKTLILDYCSIKGIAVCLGRDCFFTDEGCLSLKLLWP